MVVTWVIMAVLVVLSLILVRNLSVENPGKKQLLLESGVSFLQDFFMGILGEEGKQYVPYLMSTVIYIGKMCIRDSCKSVLWSQTYFSDYNEK